jgi:hypothetical protein
MATPKRNNHRAARVLVHATLQGDDSAAAQYRVTVRTIQNYRAALSKDEQLSHFFQEMLEKATDGWVLSMRGALQSAARRLKEFTETADLTDLDQVREIRLIFQTLGQTAVFREAIGEPLEPTESGEGLAQDQPAQTPGSYLAN